MGTTKQTRNRSGNSGRTATCAFFASCAWGTAPGMAQDADSRVIFDAEKATAAGTRTTPGGAVPACAGSRVRQEGNTLRIDFEREPVRLAGGDGGFEGEWSCTVRVPVAVPKGFYPTDFFLSAQGFLLKPAESFVRLRASATLGGREIVSERIFDWGVVPERASLFRPDDDFLRAFCVGGNARRELRLDASARVERKGVSADVTAQVESLAFEVRALGECPEAILGLR